MLKDSDPFAAGHIHFSCDLLVSAILVLLLAGTFAFYVESREQVARAYEMRYRSYQLADELRQSGDDLTRMVRTYVATGDPFYKQHFQDILDIRDGKKPRPEHYERPYWDLMLSGGPAPRLDTAQAVPLLELMRQAGFTGEEFRKLKEAKANSDALALPEIEAMKLIEAGGPDAEANRSKAMQMLYDWKYHQAKDSVMHPIHDFFVHVDQRTHAAVQSAEKRARALRFTFIAVGAAVLFMLWRTYASLRRTLGGSLDEVHAQIARLGGGDFSSPIPVRAGPENSVMGWLAATQTKLKGSDCERRLAGDELRRAEERLRLAVSAGRLGTWHWDIAAGTLEWSVECKAIFGLPLDATMTYEIFLQTLHPDDRDRTDAAVHRSLEGKTDYGIDYRAVWPDGSVHWIAATGRGFYDDSGRAVRMEGLTLDITARKRVEEELRQSEEFNRRLIASSQDCITVLDPEGNLLSMSEGGQRLLGIRDIKQYLNKNWIAFWKPEDQPSVRTAMDAARTGDGGRFRGFCPSEMGEPRWWDVIVSPIRDADGRVQRLLSISRDISVQKEAEEALQRAHDTLENRVQKRTAELEVANHELEAFSYSVSHDLRAPLRAIDGYSRILVEDFNEKLDDEGRHVLGVVRSEAQRMARLIDELLDFSRTGRQKMEPRETDMRALAETALQEATALEPAQKVCAQIADLPPAIGEPLMLRQVWANLLGNAVKFTRKCAEPHIEVGASRQNGDMVYFVRDNGAGFDMAHAGKLFGVFQRLHGEEEFEGTGVGLAFVKRIIQRHGGRVWAEGAIDQGATFYFALPDRTTTEVTS